jgi:dTDP-3-amino-3,4,6-trideoxy-alpha-D-glucose transaminase
VKLRHLDGWNRDRRRVGAALTSALGGTMVRTPLPAADGADHVFHQYVVESPARDALRDHLGACGIASAIHYPVPIHRSPAYAELGVGPGSLPISEALAERICSLPLFPKMTDEEISSIARAIEEFEPVNQRAA